MATNFKYPPRKPKADLGPHAVLFDGLLLCGSEARAKQVRQQLQKIVLGGLERLKKYLQDFLFTCGDRNFSVLTSLDDGQPEDQR